MGSAARTLSPSSGKGLNLGGESRDSESPEARVRIWYRTRLPHVLEHDSRRDPVPAVRLRRGKRRFGGIARDHCAGAPRDDSHGAGGVGDRHQPPGCGRGRVLHHQPLVRTYHWRLHRHRALFVAGDFGCLLSGRIRGSLPSRVRVGLADVWNRARRALGERARDGHLGSHHADQGCRSGSTRLIRGVRRARALHSGVSVWTRSRIDPARRHKPDGDHSGPRCFRDGFRDMLSGLHRYDRGARAIWRPQAPATIHPGRHHRCHDCGHARLLACSGEAGQECHPRGTGRRRVHHVSDCAVGSGHLCGPRLCRSVLGPRVDPCGSAHAPSASERQGLPIADAQ